MMRKKFWGLIANFRDKSLFNARAEDVNRESFLNTL